MEYQGCMQWGKVIQGPGRIFVLWKMKFWYLVEDLLPVSDQCICYMAVISCLCKQKVANLEIGWNNLPERNFMSTGAMGSGQRSTYRLNYMYMCSSKLGHHLAKEKSQVVNVHSVSRFCHPSQVHYQHLKGGVDHWTIDLVQHNLH